MNSYINSDIIAQIESLSSIEDVASDFITLTKKGSSYIGDCPLCQAKGKLSVSVPKQVWKCFSCDTGGKGAISYLTKIQGMKYLDAIRLLAEKCSVSIPNEEEAVEMESFRNLQLLGSGITQEAQEYELEDEKGFRKMDRYQSASIDQGWNLVSGNDMILHYLDLDGKPLQHTYRDGKLKPYIRVRWAIPGNHLDKDGKAIKYQTPPNGGSPLWLPQWIIHAYTSNHEYDTLYITEGEKKADALCLSGIPAVGITGIHNWSNEGPMTHLLISIIRRFNIKRVCFLLDSDCQELKPSNNADIAKRPNLFYSAVLKFKTYFQAFPTEGIDLEIFFGHGNDTVYKGVDDLLCRGIQPNHSLKSDMEAALINPKGKGEYVTVHNITLKEKDDLKKIWHLHDAKEFLDYNKTQLLPLAKFKLFKLDYEVINGQFELIQILLPEEQYWFTESIHSKSGTKTKYFYDVLQINTFLKNRGFGLYKKNNESPVRLIHLNGKVVKEVEPYDIKRFVIDFTENIEKIEVLRMLMNGSRNYFAIDKLEHMHKFQIEFLKSNRETCYLVFKDQFWKITANDIQSYKIEDLPGYVWENQLIDFTPILEKPLFKIEREGNNWILDPDTNLDKCDIANFFIKTSTINWRRFFVEIETDDGIVYKPIEPQNVPDEERHANMEHLVSKILATGYILHDYRNKAQMKAIIAVDHKETEVGRSEGGTGKSIWCTMFEYLKKIVIIDGKKPRLQDDQFLYSNVDDRTQIIVIDDCRVNLDFEFFLSQITRGIEVNPKGSSRFRIEAPKFIFSTNHAVNGEGNSFDRRQYIIAFSDYFNKNRTPYDEFGCSLFDDWNFTQWNNFFNFMACCIQTYLRYPDLNTFTIPKEDVQKRKLRQQMGEEFLEFMETWWSDKINHAVQKAWAMEEYFKCAPQDRRYLKSTQFKRKLEWYCEYAGLDFAPGEEGRVRSNGEEFLLVGDECFDRSKMTYLRNPMVND